MSAHDAVNAESFTRTWAIAALGTALVTEASVSRYVGAGVRKDRECVFGFDIWVRRGRCRVCGNGAVFGMTRDLGRFCAQHEIRINGVMPSASSRMSDLSPLIKKITREYFDASQVAVFVAALASKECPVSGELFRVCGGRAARTTLAMFLGWNGASSVESYLSNFEKVMGTRDEVYLPRDCLDQVSYAIKHASAVDLGAIDPNDA